MRTAAQALTSLASRKSLDQGRRPKSAKLDEVRAISQRLIESVVPRTSPVSSTVWWSSTHVSPSAFSFQVYAGMTRRRRCRTARPRETAATPVETSVASMRRAVQLQVFVPDQRFRRFFVPHYPFASHRSIAVCFKTLQDSSLEVVCHAIPQADPDALRMVLEAFEPGQPLHVRAERFERVLG